MLILPPCRFCLVLPILVVTACAADPPASARPRQTDAQFEPAPMPHVQYGRRGSAVGALEVPIPPKMPLGTGAVPVSGSPVRGSIVTGFKKGF